MSFGRDPYDLDYDHCTYGASRTQFRGPSIALDRPYMAVIGGSETYGKYVPQPFCAQLADQIAAPIANLGVHNGSIDVFAGDDGLMPVIAGADTVVIQVMSAANISNRFYSVHARRNDRFLRHSLLMETLFQDVDFSDFAFTRHMLATLRDCSADKFGMVQQELGEAWVARMRLLLSRIPGRKILTWIENRNAGDIGPEPLFVTGSMVDRLAPLANEIVHCDVTEAHGEDRLDGMTFPETERDGALRCLSAEGHALVAERLAQVLEPQSARVA